ncbi:MAG: DUF1501 domain-containing protein [Acidobacteria bacterium]|nr:DUF1501 domain-containing protein [Acidobacteriota bacterium]
MSTNRTTRRSFFQRMMDGVHGAALASLLQADRASAAAAYDLTPKRPHFEPKAKSVIHLFMNGGPSQVDLFDPKPALKKHAGSAPSRDIVNQIEFADQVGVMMPSPFEFKRYGQCGMEMTELMPHLGSVADEVAFIRSTYGEHFNHEPSLYLMHSGRTLPGRPSLGAWVTYGLGSENQNLPAYVVLDDPKGLPINLTQNWQSGWLPPIYQGTRFRSEGLPLLNLRPPEELPSPLVEAQRELLRELDAAHLAQRPMHAGDLEARVASYELAARMQLSATDALDLTQETEATREMYGLNEEATQSYGRRCLMARRLVERGVRFVQLFIEGQIWDTHSNLEKDLRYCCAKTDKPIGALIRDLKQRGLLGSTLILYSGEFGRMPISQLRAGGAAGRDHGPGGFTTWMAGAGIKGGTIHGATDEIGHKAVENRVSVHDFHATMLHLLGLRFRDLAFTRHSLSERLTDQYPARVVREILA